MEKKRKENIKGNQETTQREQGLADEDLQAINNTIESATKKRCSNDFVNHQIPKEVEVGSCQDPWWLSNTQIQILYLDVK